MNLTKRRVWVRCFLPILFAGFLFLLPSVPSAGGSGGQDELIEEEIEQGQQLQLRATKEVDGVPDDDYTTPEDPPAISDFFGYGDPDSDYDNDPSRSDLFPPNPGSPEWLYWMLYLSLIE
jgi:hypothetical protein